VRIDVMNKKDLQAFAQAAAKNIKSQEDLNQFQQILTKITVEAAHNCPASPVIA
jgi:hypothetical protein|tara:strand:- start:114 stop:275 length:162 start_codon:yes stop_codon:yes gene_type:complete